MQRGGGFDSRHTPRYSSSSHGGYEDKRGSTGGYEDRRAADSRSRPGPSSRGFEVRRDANGFDDRRSSHQQQDRDLRNNQGHSRHTAHETGDRRDKSDSRRDDRGQRQNRGEESRRQSGDPWSTWQTSKSDEPGRSRRHESGHNQERTRDRRDDRDRDRDRRNDREREEQKRKEEERKIEEKRRADDRRMQELLKREEEIKRKEEKLRRLEESRKREEEMRQREEKLRRREEERRRDEERRRSEQRRRQEQRSRRQSRSRSPNPKVFHNLSNISSSSSSSRRDRSSHSSQERRDSSRQRSSALDRLGPKVPVVSRLGSGKVSRKRRRPGSKERSPGHEDSDNMQITIAVDKSEEAGTVRKVERDVDIDNFTVVDQVFGDDAEKNEEQKNSEDNAGDKPDNVVDLEKVVIKRRDKKDDRKSSDGKDLVIKKPSSLISKLAKHKQTLSNSQTEASEASSVEMTDQERSEIRKRCKAKYVAEDKVTEKVISMALDLVQFHELKTCELIDQILAEDQEESQGLQSTDSEAPALDLSNCSTVDGKVENKSVNVPTVSANEEDAHDQLDFEAEETEEPDRV